MDLSRPARAGLALFTVLGFVFLYTPLVIVPVLSFNTSRTFTWPPEARPYSAGKIPVCT